MFVRISIQFYSDTDVVRIAYPGAGLWASLSQRARVVWNAWSGSEFFRHFVKSNRSDSLTSYARTFCQTFKSPKNPQLFDTWHMTKMYSSSTWITFVSWCSCTVPCCSVSRFPSRKLCSASVVNHPIPMTWGRPLYGLIGWLVCTSPGRYARGMDRGLDAGPHAWSVPEKFWAAANSTFPGTLCHV